VALLPAFVFPKFSKKPINGIYFHDALLNKLNHFSNLAVSRDFAAIFVRSPRIHPCVGAALRTPAE
jgi:hypothetical protein